MHKGTVVEQILRSLSFDVEAVPQDNLIEVSTTSKATPLNVKIRVRKKDKAGIQSGAVSLFKPNQYPNEVPERIRLVSSDQTIMSFNVIMEEDIQNPIRKPRTNILGIFKPSSCLGAQPDEEEYAYLPKSINKADIDEDNKNKSKETLTKLNLSKNDDTVTSLVPRKHKDFFGKCKPGGCLDPPFGEDRGPYTISMANERASTSEYTTRDKTSSIFSKIINKWNKKSNSEQAFPKEPSRTASVVNIFHAGSLHTNSYSNSIITYPPTLNSSEIRLKEDKSHFNKTNVTPSQQNSFDESSGTYFTVPKKAVLDTRDKSNVAKTKEDGVTDDDDTKCDTTKLIIKNPIDNNKIQGKSNGSLINQAIIGISNTNDVLVADKKPINIKGITGGLITDMEVNQNLQDSKVIKKLHSSASLSSSEHKSHLDIWEETKRDEIKYIELDKNQIYLIDEESKSVSKKLESDSKENDNITIDSETRSFNDNVEKILSPEVHSNNLNMHPISEPTEIGKNGNSDNLVIESLKLNDFNNTKNKQKVDCITNEQNHTKITDQEDSGIQENYVVSSENYKVELKNKINLDKPMELQSILNEKQLKVQNSTGKKYNNHDSSNISFSKSNEFNIDQSKVKYERVMIEQSIPKITDNDESEKYVVPSEVQNSTEYILIHDTENKYNNHKHDSSRVKSNDLNIIETKQINDEMTKEQNYSTTSDKDESENCIIPNEKRNLSYSKTSENHKIVPDDFVECENNKNLDKGFDPQFKLNGKQMEVPKIMEKNNLGTESNENLNASIFRKTSQTDSELLNRKFTNINVSDTIIPNNREFYGASINNMKSENTSQEFQLSGKSIHSLLTMPESTQKIDINEGFDYSPSSSNLNESKSSTISDKIEQKSADTSIQVTGPELKKFPGDNLKTKNNNVMFVPKQSVEILTKTESQNNFNKSVEKSVVTLDEKPEMSLYDIVTASTDKIDVGTDLTSYDDIVLHNKLVREGDPQKISLSSPHYIENDFINIWENSKHPILSQRLIDTDHDLGKQFDIEQYTTTDLDENIKNTEDALFMESLNLPNANEDTDDRSMYKKSEEINDIMNLENVLTDSIIENRDNPYINYGTDSSQLMDNTEILHRVNNQSVIIRTSQNKLENSRSNLINEQSPENLIKTESHENILNTKPAHNTDHASFQLLSPSLNEDKEQEDRTDLLIKPGSLITLREQNEPYTENKLEENNQSYPMRQNNSVGTVRPIKFDTSVLGTDNGYNDILLNTVEKATSSEMQTKISHKINLAQVINNSVPDDHSLKRLVIPDSQKRSTDAVTEINFAIQSYSGDNNNVIVKSLNADIEADRYPNDTYVLIKRSLALNDEIKIPISLKHDLCIQVKRNKQDNDGGVSRGSGTSFNYEMDISKRHETIADEIRKTLVAVHEEELVPLRNTITELRENITYVISQQMMIRDNMLKRVKHVRMIPPRKCGCMRK